MGQLNSFSNVDSCVIKKAAKQYGTPLYLYDEKTIVDNRESLKELYFCTNTSSKFAVEISKKTKASVYFYSKRLVWKGCLLKGNMEIVTDMSIKEKYWQNKFKNAYPQKAFTDPDFCVLKFVPESGRFYSWYNSNDFEI